MKRNIIRKNTGLNGISIERQIEIPDYDMTLLKLSTMTPYLEGRRVHKILDHNKKKDIPLNMIIYEASEKLTENPSKPYPQNGLDTAAFRNPDGQQLTMTSHTFENGIGTIEFDGDIASIGRYAFYGCNELTNIEIPSSVTSIGTSAFDNTSWWNIYLADTSHYYGNIIYINDVAYKVISTATSCEFKKETVSITPGAFDGCSSLTSIEIPSSVTSIDSFMFRYCESLESVTIPDSVTSIGNQAFYGCTKLTSINIPDSVISISEGAFDSCSSLESITIPDSVTHIGNDAFRGCSSLTSIISFAMTAPTIYKTTFQNVKTNGTLTVPNGSTGYDVWIGTGKYYLGYYGWDSNVTPTPQVGNITITKNGKEITLVPPAGYYNDKFGNNGLSAYDDGGTVHMFSIYKDDRKSVFHSRIMEDGTLADGMNGPGSDFIDIFNANTNTALQPELITWLEAQGFTIPIE